VGAGAFLRFCARECEAKKRTQKRKEKKAQKKDKAPSAKEKTQIHAFSSPHSGKPVSEPKAARQGGKARVLSKMYSSVGMLNRKRRKYTEEETQGRDIGEGTEG
jgi:hypothetical protein